MVATLQAVLQAQIAADRHSRRNRCPGPLKPEMGPDSCERFMSFGSMLVEPIVRSAFWSGFLFRTRRGGVWSGEDR